MSLLESMRVINDNALGTAFVVDDAGVMMGILTDGDIRRVLLDGKSLDEKVADHANTNFTSASVDDDLQALIAMMNQKVKILPILDSEGKVVDVFQYESKLRLPVAEPNLRGNEFKYLVDAFMSTWISSAGAYLDRFEAEFSAFCQCKHGVATSNGTVAIHLALVALDIGPGDEVIVPDLTFAATINAVILAGATPVIVDVEQDTWCIDPKQIEAAITDKTKAVIPVHLYGQPCDMDAIMSVAKAHDLKVIEDAAEAHGAQWKGQRVGSFGDISTFSFFGNKLITTGEGGMCVTNSAELDAKMRVLRDHGMNKQRRYWHDVVGFNYRMTNLQASIGVAQLERIDEILANKVEIENSYKEVLKDCNNIDFVQDSENRSRVIWLVCATFNDGNRDEYMEVMRAEGIDIRPFFYPLSEMPVFSKYTHSCKVSQEVSKIGINFPSVHPVNEKTAAILRRVFNS